MTFVLDCSESLTGYMVRVGNAFALSLVIFVRRVLDLETLGARIVVKPDVRVGEHI